MLEFDQERFHEGLGYLFGDSEDLGEQGLEFRLVRRRVEESVVHEVGDEGSERGLGNGHVLVGKEDFKSESEEIWLDVRVEVNEVANVSVLEEDEVVAAVDD